MPLVDRRTNSVVLRIVYDGPPEAGKTTNLRQLCERLSLSRRGQLDSPGGGERTQYFDWLDVTGGWVGGHRVRCQLVTVPGQIQLARRRRHILDTADVVVFVADSRASAAPETGAALRSLARGLDSRADIPLVLQANKQDLPGAQPPDQLHAALGLAARVPVVAAQAAGGAGVLESFMLAVRLAVDHVRALLVAGDLGEGEASTAAELLRALQIDAPTASEVFEALDTIDRAAGAPEPGPDSAAIEALEASQETTAAPDATPDVATADTTADEAIDTAWEASTPVTSRTITRPIRTGQFAPLELDRAVTIPAPIAAAPVPPLFGMAGFATAVDAPAGSDSVTRPIRGVRSMAAAPDDRPAREPALAAPSAPLEPDGPPVVEHLAVEPPPAPPARREPQPYFGTDEDPTWELEPVDPRTPAILETGYEPSAPIAIAIAIDTRAATEPGPMAFEEPEPVRAPAPPAPAPAAPPPAEPHIEVIVAVARRTPASTPPMPLPIPPPPAPLIYQLPPIDLPAGMVWPGVSGRAALASLGTPVRLVERPASWAPRAAIELACGDSWLAHSAPELVYPELDAGRPALFDAVRWQAKLTHLTPPGRTYALAPDRDGFRLWVLTPTYRTVWAEIERAFAAGDRAAAGRLARSGLEAVDELRARGVQISDLEHIAIDDPPRLLATPWTPGRDRLVGQLQRLFAAAVL